MTIEIVILATIYFVMVMVAFAELLSRKIEREAKKAKP